MPDPVSGHLIALSRRDFLKITLGALMITVNVGMPGGKSGVPAPLGSTGYGSGKYGAGKYGITSHRYSIFLSIVRK
jgi:hypothetical protein